MLPQRRNVRGNTLAKLAPRLGHHGANLFLPARDVDDVSTIGGCAAEGLSKIEPLHVLSLTDDSTRSTSLAERHANSARLTVSSCSC